MSFIKRALRYWFIEAIIALGLFAYLKYQCANGGCFGAFFVEIIVVALVAPIFIGLISSNLARGAVSTISPSAEQKIFVAINPSAGLIIGTLLLAFAYFSSDIFSFLGISTVDTGWIFVARSLTPFLSTIAGVILVCTSLWGLAAPKR